MRTARQTANKWFPPMLVMACVLTLLAFSESRVTKAPGADKPAAGKSDTKKATKKRRKARGRVPNYYGQIGLSPEQKKKVYAIQKQYLAQMLDLFKQLRALRTKQQAEIDTVLTPQQLVKVKDLREAAAKKRADRKKKRSSKKSD